MIVSAYGFEEVIQPGRVVLDPSRVAAQVVSGIGFLGAGLILRRNQTVHGLTTAASVWAVAAIGLAAGGGLYLAATAATVLMLAILAAIKPVEDRFFGRGRHRTLRLTTSEKVAVADLEPLLRGHGLNLVGWLIRSGERPGQRQIDITCEGLTEAKLPGVLDAVKGLEGVHDVSSGLSGD
jgi:putative Mg2+ transporter-C (MgtC) family protein